MKHILYYLIIYGYYNQKSNCIMKKYNILGFLQPLIKIDIQLSPKVSGGVSCATLIFTKVFIL